MSVVVINIPSLALFFRNEESNLGNVITDSMVACWNGEVSIGFVNNGGIRSNLVEGEITGEDILNVLPFNNTVDKVIQSVSLEAYNWR